MPEKYDLARMWEEIDRDEAWVVESAKSRLLSQSEIIRLEQEKETPRQDDGDKR